MILDQDILKVMVFLSEQKLQYPVQHGVNHRFESEEIHHSIDVVIRLYIILSDSPPKAIVLASDIFTFA